MAPGLGLVRRIEEDVDISKLKEMFPQKKSTITDETVEIINRTMNDPEFNGVSILETMTTYENVMYKNKSSMKDYLNAIKFCAYLEGCEDSTVDAYKKTFGDREFVRERINAATDSAEYKELTSAATRFRKKSLVVDILTQADVPLYLMFQGYRYKAVGVLAEEMISADYAKDRINAADKLLTHVTTPEKVEVEMNLGVKENSVIDDYEASIAKMVEEQKKLIAAGADLKAVANAKIKGSESEEVIDAEYDDSNKE